MRTDVLKLPAVDCVSKKTKEILAHHTLASTGTTA